MINPGFAVVGHPNKGKSSIVSTLSHNDSIFISERSGTTTKSFAYKVETQRSGYQLFDTPGFQRPTKVLAWLKKHTDRADQRAQVVANFITDPECQQLFPDEVELLKPLVNGAAILYVVDGSRPYGTEYDIEMEILQWTGQASMALINPIENETHVESWSNALAQYFKTVRVFNPMKAEFDKQIELLKSFAHLKPEWATAISLVTEDLITEKNNNKKNSAIILSRLLEDLCFYRETQKVITQEQSKLLKPLLEKKYQLWMKRREQNSINELFALYAHFQTQYRIDDLVLPPNLFDTEQWYMWGLNKIQLASVATISGATAGAVADMAVAGHSLMLGAIGGGLLGFGSAWFGADKLIEVKLKGLPLGGYEAIFGPVKNKNFPYVVIGRFVYLHSQISQRSHALRDNMLVEQNVLQQQISGLEKSEQKTLHKACQNLLNQKQTDNLAEILELLF